MTQQSISLLPLFLMHLFVIPPVMALASTKFYLFCDIFTIPESDHLPVSFELLHSFSLWAATDPSMLTPGMPTSVHFKPVLFSVIQKYPAAIWAWNLAQGWPAPLSEDSHSHINWSLHGLKNLQGPANTPFTP